MNKNSSNDIKAVLQQLKCNDHFDYYDVYITPNPPNNLIRELSTMKASVIEEVESFALNNLGRYSSLYAINVLGNIQTSESASSLLRIKHVMKEKGFTADEVIFSLQKHGKEAVIPVLDYAKKARQRNDDSDWLGAMEGIEFQKDSRIVDELLEGLDAFVEITEFTIDLLGKQRDKRCVEPIISILKEEPDFVVAWDTLEMILSPEKYQEVRKTLNLI